MLDRHCPANTDAQLGERHQNRRANGKLSQTAAPLIDGHINRCRVMTVSRRRIVHLNRFDLAY